MNYDILSSRKTNLAPCQLTVCRWVDSWVAISKFRDYWQQNSCSKKVPSSKDDLLCSAGSLRLLSRLVLGQRKKKNATTASGCEFGIKILRFFPKKGGLWNKRSSLVPALKGFCVPPLCPARGPGLAFLSALSLSHSPRRSERPDKTCGHGNLVEGTGWQLKNWRTENKSKKETEEKKSKHVSDKRSEPGRDSAQTQVSVPVA